MEALPAIIEWRVRILASAARRSSGAPRPLPPGASGNLDVVLNRQRITPSALKRPSTRTAKQETAAWIKETRQEELSSTN
jgi:hypothetical protein